MFKIEKGIEIPPRTPYSGANHCNTAKYPWKELEIGDSFFVPQSDEVSRYALYNRLRSSACQAAKRLGTHHTVRLVDGGVRVWRVPNKEGEGE